MDVLRVAHFKDFRGFRVYLEILKVLRVFWSFFRLYRFFNHFGGFHGNLVILELSRVFDYLHHFEEFQLYFYHFRSLGNFRYFLGFKRFCSLRKRKRKTFTTQSVFFLMKEKWFQFDQDFQLLQTPKNEEKKKFPKHILCWKDLRCWFLT